MASQNLTTFNLNETTVSFELRLFSKCVCFATLLLIFAGGMVTSTGSGLAVPDWPLSYGMMFPPMVGGVFYEHGHRMIATTVGVLTAVQCFWILKVESRSWLRKLAVASLILVILQGLLGGLTVIFLLPTAISVSHAVTAQSFFIITICIAYFLSKEFLTTEAIPQSSFWKTNLLFSVSIFIQLILGAVMRHTASGLAIPDFPTMGGQWIPMFDESMLSWINNWHFQNLYDSVTLSQVMAHFLHRVGAVIVLISFLLLIRHYFKTKSQHTNLVPWLGLLLGIQILLGIYTVWTHKSPVLTSFHVVTGAALLGLSVLSTLRTLPKTWTKSWGHHRGG